MSEHQSQLGKQLDEYRLEKLLGRGGMASVYRAVDTQLLRYVAIKVIDAQFRDDAEYVRRFEREAQAIARFDHPNVVSLYRYGNVDGLLYMAMQYIEGSDLQRTLDAYRDDAEFMAEDEALRIMREAGSGLDYAHKQGVIHRDVKPSNIMLAEDGTAIIADFGLVLMTDVGTRGEIFGTPHYMSPEQAVSSAKVVPQSDVYSMGVILYEMFTNRLPFEEGEPLDIAMAHVGDDPPPPRTYRPDLSPAVEQVILKALEKEPQNRYQSCAALADALANALQQRPNQQTTLPRHSILERVQLDMEANPLPPIPAAVRAARQVPEMPPQPTVVASGKPPLLREAKSKPPKRGLAAYILYALGGGAVALTVMLAVLFVLSSRSMTDANSTATAIVQNNIAVAVQLTRTAAAMAATPIAQPTQAVPTAEIQAVQSTVVVPTVEIQAVQPTVIPTAEAPAIVTPVIPVIESQPETQTIVIYIHTEGNKALRITNVTRETALNLANLVIIRTKDNDRFGEINLDRLDGRIWSPDAVFLENGQCVDALENDRQSPPKNAFDCAVQATHVLGHGEKAVWDKDYSVYYANELVKECQNDTPCQVQITVPVEG